MIQYSPSVHFFVESHVPRDEHVHDLLHLDPISSQIFFEVAGNSCRLPAFFQATLPEKEQLVHLKITPKWNRKSSEPKLHFSGSSC